jgi:hypothetical protein
LVPSARVAQRRFAPKYGFFGPGIDAPPSVYRGESRCESPRQKKNDLRAKKKNDILSFFFCSVPKGL